jgi:transcription elongation factor Elf1
MKSQIKTKFKKLTVECLLCGKDIYVGDNSNVLKFISCNNCNTLFEIIRLNPVMIDWPYYDDDEGFYDDLDDEYYD